MSKNQLVVIKWLSTTGQNFLSDIVELEGAFDGVPEDVAEAFATLSDREKIEVIQKAANNLLYQ
ncbi:MULTISPECIES: hypothetical protein [Paenibacillus]|uniref:Uncharacterized protein n=1 Tax=Paenibacillus taichungensis TaxID=484184 RepID=A0ABX2MDL4_9BACL|nr:MULTISPECIES: hypothetical protein [Paenibacillus]MCZ1268250.1 hypothetical protein [Paenibacillus tundrae]NUU53033.1 hypothetical protein [Paenibacillus taichungensis]SLK15790.1 hypothetical protein SAMN06272722_1108 [Paenibacillus sp. RU5A]SOC74072.1 hypothetical protein SAMN05880581_1108 [Paenibacillus sp. RU26A]SOC76247.1 hypothetical protein SAMN05880586_1108 [Paenibacillus sp. RU5M]